MGVPEYASQRHIVVLPSVPDPLIVVADRRMGFTLAE
jgi:hypothetical protein